MAPASGTLEFREKLFDFFKSGKLKKFNQISGKTQRISFRIIGGHPIVNDLKMHITNNLVKRNGKKKDI